MEIIKEIKIKWKCKGCNVDNEITAEDLSPFFPLTHVQCLSSNQWERLPNIDLSKVYEK